MNRYDWLEAARVYSTAFVRVCFGLVLLAGAYWIVRQAP